jgi:hypothetical protein
MSNLRIEIVPRLLPLLRAGDLDACERAIIAQMQSLPHSPFHIALDLAISNDPVHAAEHFDRFFLTEAQRFKVAAASTEMNDFDINPDLWYCDLFAYTTFGGHENYDYEWLCKPTSKPFGSYVIKGLEDLQAVYASREGELSREEYDAFTICDLLVEVKFHRFMERAAAEMKALAFPLLVTVHDSDFIAEFRPKFPGA